MMIHLKNFTPYNPVFDKDHPLNNLNASFLKSEDGVDWYECQSGFLADTIKVMYGADGVIRATSNENADHDVSRLFPSGCSVLELEADEFSRKLDNSGSWIVLDGIVKPREVTSEERKRKAEEEKQRLYASGKALLEPLIFAQEMGNITPKEQQKLALVKTFLVTLYRVDTSSPEEIMWPVLPTN